MKQDAGHELVTPERHKCGQVTLRAREGESDLRREGVTMEERLEAVTWGRECHTELRAHHWGTELKVETRRVGLRVVAHREVLGAVRQGRRG